MTFTGFGFPFTPFGFGFVAGVCKAFLAGTVGFLSRGALSELSDLMSLSAELELVESI